ncbi:helix-turn-helix domain-containing protein, partial [Pseudomonas sp. NMI4491_12]|uniref:helix-turn-helix domain-containing protein n=1 Tax=Pseudomonas sp. NMI4491_12 TaxID=2903146 RepID=UPI001E3523D3
HGTVRQRCHGNLGFHLVVGGVYGSVTIEHAEMLVAAGKSVAQIACLLGVHRATLYRSLSRAQE